MVSGLFKRLAFFKISEKNNNFKNQIMQYEHAVSVRIFWVPFKMFRRMMNKLAYFVRNDPD